MHLMSHFVLLLIKQTQKRSLSRHLVAGITGLLNSLIEVLMMNSRNGALYALLIKIILACLKAILRKLEKVCPKLNLSRNTRQILTPMKDKSGISITKLVWLIVRALRREGSMYLQDSTWATETRQRSASLHTTGMKENTTSSTST